MELRVSDNPSAERYEVFADDALAGFTQYRARDGLIAFMHTEVGDAYEGQGVGSALVRFALDDARERSLDVLPFCPFVNRYIERHDEYASLVPGTFRAKFGV